MGRSRRPRTVDRRGISRARPCSALAPGASRFGAASRSSAGVAAACRCGGGRARSLSGRAGFVRVSSVASIVDQFMNASCDLNGAVILRHRAGVASGPAGVRVLR
jgi:hypothetical protein